VIKHFALALGALALASAVASAAPNAVAIRLKGKAEADPRAVFEVTGIDAADLRNLTRTQLTAEQWQALFAVYAGERPADGQQPAMLGSYRVEGQVLRFEPRFPLAPGVRYRAVFDPSKLPGRPGKADLVAAEFTLPKPKTVPAVVEQIYPSRGKLPENQLKFYIHFSAPMGQGNSYRHIRLFTASGKEVVSPWLELGEELWSPDGKRFTLFIDPGRIKHGLKPREDLGPVLEAGKTYTLVIDRAWTDANGNPLKETYRKTFQAVAAEEKPIDEKTWKVHTPPPGATEPLIVTFPRPLDHAMLHRVLWVTDAKGEKVPGTVKVTDEETRWQFTPERPWRPGAYRLVADVTLEDLAGNQVGQPFEVDVFKPIQRERQLKTVELPFEVVK
jgi:hypothetical protein